MHRYVTTVWRPTSDGHDCKGNRWQDARLKAGATTNPGCHFGAEREYDFVERYPEEAPR